VLPIAYVMTKPFSQVYHQIESMAEALAPKSRRNKSTSLLGHSSRTSSPQAELSSITPSARSRPSSEGRPRSIPSPLGEPRTSSEKLRRRDSGKGHTRNSSVKSDIFRQVDDIYDPAEVNLLYLSNKHSDIS